MSLPDTEYPFISAYLKGEEARIVTSDHISRVLKASSIQDVLDTIRNTDVGNYLEGEVISSFGDADQALWKYFSRCIDHLEWFRLAPDDIIKILKAYVIKYDVLNIKAVLAGISHSRKASMIPAGAIHNNGVLDRLSDADNVDDIIGLLTMCNLGNYAAIIEEYRTERGVKSELLTETRLDSEYYRNLLDVIKTTQDCDILLRAFGIMIDMINLQFILRAILTETGQEAAKYTVDGGYMITSEVAKELLSLKPGEIPGRAGHLYRDMTEEVVNSYNRTRNITDIDEIIDKYRFRLIKEILSPRILSPSMVVWYLILKEVEIRNLRLILKAIFDNMLVERIGRYLVVL